MAKRTTTVFDAEAALVALLEAQTWPSHPTTGEAPLVVDADTRDVFDEAVIVLGSTGASSSEWKTMGAPSKDESYTLKVRVGTKVDGCTQAEARSRLKELVAVVEVAHRSAVTGQPAGGYVASVAGGVQYMTWRVTVVEHAVYALAPPQGGFGAFADLDISFVARI